MGTLVDSPYVNHIPPMTVGVGSEQLSRFYKHHFVDSNPADTKLIPISRTVGADRLVDEILFCFTHDCEIDWMLPGAVDTDTSRDFPPPKMPPTEVAEQTLDALETGEEELHPGDMATGVSQGLNSNTKAVEKEFAQYLPMSANEKLASSRKTSHREIAD